MGIRKMLQNTDSKLFIVLLPLLLVVAVGLFFVTSTNSSPNEITGAVTGVDNLITGLAVGDLGNVWITPPINTKHKNTPFTVTIGLNPKKKVSSGIIEIEFPSTLVGVAVNNVKLTGGAQPTNPPISINQNKIKIPFVNFFPGYPANTNSEVAKITFTTKQQLGNGELKLTSNFANDKITTHNNALVAVKSCADLACGQGKQCNQQSGLCENAPAPPQPPQGGQGGGQQAAGKQISNGLFRAESAAPQNLQVGQFYDFTTTVTALDNSLGQDLFIVTVLLDGDKVVGFKKDMVPGGMQANSNYVSKINYKYLGKFTKKVYVYNANVILSDENGDPLINVYQ